MYTGIHAIYLLMLGDFNKTWIFSTDFRKLVSIKSYEKSVQWEPRLSIWTDEHRTDGQTDRQTWRS